MKGLIFGLALIALTGCNYGDGIQDESIDDAMVREANCVAACERFGLYSEAERHREHGEIKGALRFERIGELNDFGNQIHSARERMHSYTKEINASYLQRACDTKLLMSKFNTAD